uniref:ATP synthase mitochondrial F1 complex assembly factor 1 n=1 Tax=Sphenodon punctatus TaxID=8508 RepID=A0A8D0GPB9_SPHPU
MEKRSEVKNQPVWHSKQGEFVRCVEEKAETLDAAASKGGFTREKTLDLILNLEMVKEKTAEEIKQIWKQYYSAKDTFYAVIPAKKFDLIWKRAQSCPSFLCALPRREGYEFFMGQWVGTELHYTALINVQNVVEAHCLANQVKLFYATDRPELYDLVETFNHRPSEFKYMAVIAELEQNGIGKELRPDGDFENV